MRRNGVRSMIDAGEPSVPVATGSVRDPRKNPRIGDTLKSESGHTILVTGVTSMHPRVGYQVAYIILPEDAGRVCGLSAWRKAQKNTVILTVAT